MANSPEKLLYSRRDTAEVLSLSIRSVDYLIASGRLSMRRIGGKILIPATAISRFAREDHPELVREKIRPRVQSKPAERELYPTESRFEAVSERVEGSHSLISTRRA